MFSARIIEVFVASPSDLPEEREAIRGALSDWNALNGEATRWILLPRSWESHSTPGVSVRPQEAINSQVLRQADVLVGCFWTRFGSATESYGSGTVEEIERAVASNKHALLYFSDRPVVPASVDPVQFAEMMSFKDSMFKRGLCGRFASPADLRAKLVDDLTRVVRELAPKNPESSSFAAARLLSPSGETAFETRDEAVLTAKHQFARPAFQALALWESGAHEPRVIRRWYRDLEFIWDSLGSSTGKIAQSIGYDRPLTRYLREELAWYRKCLDNDLRPLEGYDPLPEGTDLAKIANSITDFLTRARTLAEADWLSIDS